MKATTLRPVKAPLVPPVSAVSIPPPVPSGAQIRAARTLSRLTRLLIRGYGEKHGRKILIEAIQQRLRTKKDIREIVAARVAANGIDYPTPNGAAAGAKR